MAFTGFQRTATKRLLRYLARPAVPENRRRLLQNGNGVVELKRTWANGRAATRATPAPYSTAIRTHPRWNRAPRTAQTACGDSDSTSRARPAPLVSQVRCHNDRTVRIRRMCPAFELHETQRRAPTRRIKACHWFRVVLCGASFIGRIASA